MRPPYKRTMKEFVVLHPIRVGGERGTLQRGDTVLASELRTHVLRLFYNRRRIGLAGHPHTEAALERIEYRAEQQRKKSLARAIAKGKINPEDLTEEELAEVQQLILNQVSSAPTEETDDDQGDGGDDDTDDDDETDDPVMEHVGGGMYEVTINGETHRVKGKEAAQELIDGGQLQEDREGRQEDDQ